MKMNEINKKAFTLVELLVVISIIAMLLAILMPSLQKTRAQAKKVVCLSGMRQLGFGCQFYASDNNNKLPKDSTSDTAWGTYKIFMGSWAALGTLYADGYIKDLNVYWCPSAKGDFSQKYNMDRKWIKNGTHMDPEANADGERVLRSYQFRGKFLKKEGQKVIDSSRLAIVMDVFLPPSPTNPNPIPSHSNGYNVVFVDGSGSFFKVDPKNNEFQYSYRNPLDAPGYLRWAKYYAGSSQWDWWGIRAVWGVLDASY
ncbi:MAG: prepilin-type N-terminal cleavage/methylation domain-containing protein [Anaerohalosphaeraceae bacterium]|nr:prepilin-type N-terminal cleavage/methylation domain-containing protein [Anaerohalosphaeraceae bacterium]